MVNKKINQRLEHAKNQNKVNGDDDDELKFFKTLVVITFFKSYLCKE